MSRFRLGSIQLSAMLAALLLSAGLVMRISATLSPVAPETRSDTAAGRAIQLRDDRNGVTMFDGVALAPGDTESRCITVTATGTRTPEQVVLLATRTLDEGLGPWLRLDIVQGRDATSSATCQGFKDGATMLSGTAMQVMPALERGLPWVPAPSEVVPGGHATTYRVIATLADDTPNEIMGMALDFDLAWKTSFDAAGGSIFQRGFALALRFTEDSMIPMLAILSLAIMFLGIQNRLDGASPALTHAALKDDTVEFIDLTD